MSKPTRLKYLMYLMMHMLGEDIGWELDELHLRLDAASTESERDGVLQECTDGECMVCGVIICPYHEPLHFHHDGCPACSQ
jgi:hypothetical protein